MTKFRPCIDLHDGKVKQIVGSSLSDFGGELKTNFETNQTPAYFAQKYESDKIKGGHVIMLGKGNESAAKAALSAYPGGLQIGGGINAQNAMEYIQAGASHVIVTSWIFPNGILDKNRLNDLINAVGKDRLVLDLSCKINIQNHHFFIQLFRDLLEKYDKVLFQKFQNLDFDRIYSTFFNWFYSHKKKIFSLENIILDFLNRTPLWNITINRWQTITNVPINEKNLTELEQKCSEFLIHAADVEGKQQGMDLWLIYFLSKYCSIPVTYAGGAKSLEDLEHCKEISNGKIDLTIGSALDLFGGKGVKYDDCVKFNKAQG